jgi:hypothetical protein
MAFLTIMPENNELPRRKQRGIMMEYFYFLTTSSGELTLRD